jgi:hypothetical protein
MLMLTQGAENSSEQGADASGDKDSDAKVAEGSTVKKLYQWCEL